MGEPGAPFVKGYLARLSNGRIEAFFPFQFNPTELTRGVTASYKFTSTPGSVLPQACFSYCEGGAMSCTLLLDAVENFDPAKGGVMAQEMELESYTTSDVNRFVENPGAFVPPPQCRLGLGQRSWPLLMVAVQFKEVRFSKDGYPTRAYADLTLKPDYRSMGEVMAYFQQIQRMRKRVVQHVGPDS